MVDRRIHRISLLILSALSYIVFMTGALVFKVSAQNAGAPVKCGKIYGNDICLVDGRAVIRDSFGNVLFESDQSWRVDDLLVCDIDHDGEDEMMLLLWKRGKYGEHMPFYEKENDQSFGQHIFIYKKRTENVDKYGFMKAVWMSSAIKEEVSSWDFSEKERLTVTIRDSGEVRHFDWKSWGLSEYWIPPARVSFACFGDLIAHEQIRNHAEDHAGGNYDFIFENVKDKINKVDIAVLTQETPLTKEENAFSGYPFFNSPAALASAEEKAGIDIVACATNHMLDQGAKGLLDTLDIYKDTELLPLGIHESSEDIAAGVCIREGSGIRIAFCDFCYGSNRYIGEDAAGCIETLKDEKRVRACLKYAGENADATVVFVHWGDEYKSAISSEQEDWTRIFKEEGADVVIGSHPHVLQPYEMKDGMLIYYSLGNFVTGQDRPERVLGGMAWFDIVKRGDDISVEAYGLEPLICHQERRGIYTAYLLRDYTDELAGEHRLDISIADMWKMKDRELL